MKNSVCVTGLC